MVFKKKQPNASVVVGKKENLFIRLRRKVQMFHKKQWIIIASAALIIFIGTLVGLYIYGEFKGRDVAPQGNDEIVDEAVVNEMVKQLDADPASVPSGGFMPELGDDFFINEEDRVNEEPVQQ